MPGVKIWSTAFFVSLVDNENCFKSQILTHSVTESVHVCVIIKASNPVLNFSPAGARAAAYIGGRRAIEAKARGSVWGEVGISLFLSFVA